MTITISTAGESGNSFVLIAKVVELMERAKRPKSEIEKFKQDSTSSNSYDELLQKLQVKCIRLSYFLDEEVKIV